MKFRGEREDDVEAFLYFRLLAATAAADGHIHPTEVERLRELITRFGGNPESVGPLCHDAERSNDLPLWFVRRVKELPPRSFHMICIRDAWVMAHVGGPRPTRRTLGVIASYADEMGLSTYLDKLATRPRPRRHVVTTAREITEEKDDLDVTLDRANGQVLGLDDGFVGHIYFRFLAAIAAADGKIEPHEVDRIADILEITELDLDVADELCEQAMARRIEPLWFLGTIQSYTPAFAAACLRDGNLLALARGRVTSAEQRLLQRAAKHMGVRDFEPQVESKAVEAARLKQEAEAQAQEDAAAQEKLGEELGQTLGYTGGVTLASTSAFAVAGGKAAKASLMMGAAAGLGGWIVPAALLIGGGVARSLVALKEQLEEENKGA